MDRGYENIVVVQLSLARLGAALAKPHMLFLRRRSPGIGGIHISSARKQQ